MGKSKFSPEALTGELLSVIRAQRHEFLNHLQVIMGLVQLGKREEAVAYIKEISAAIMESGRATHLPWPELAAAMVLGEKKVKESGGRYQFGLNCSLENFPIGPPETVEVISEVYDVFCQFFQKHQVDGGGINVEVTEEKGAYAIRFTLQQAPANPLDKIEFLSHPVMERARRALEKIEMEEIGDYLIITLYLPRERDRG